jgi:glucose/mannose-6-phosphate isomerase
MIAADSGRLDDPAALAAADPGEMLRQVASGAAQIRRAQLGSAEAGVHRVAADGRPRAVVILGTGGSGVVGDVLAAVCGAGCPVPVVPVRGYRLPGWVGAADLVIAVSASGRTEETLELAAQAVRRGCRLLFIGAADSPLAALATQSRSPLVPVEPVGLPRAMLWGLTVPALLAVRALGLLELPDAVLEGAAARLEDIAHRCRPSSESFVNPAKQLAADLVGLLPLVWGSSELAGAAAYRLCCQFNENAKYPAVPGVLPEAAHNQVEALGGFFGSGRGGGADDFFRDRVDDPETGLHLLVLRDTEEHPQVARRRAASVELARSRGVAVTEIAAEGVHPLERIATMIAIGDYVTVYLAIALGFDPTAVAAIRELRARIA